MISELIQKRFFIKRTIAIYENKVTYRISRFSNETEVSISYEDLTDRKEAHTMTLLSSLIFMGGSAFLSGVSYLWRNDKEYDPDAWKLGVFLFIISTIVYFFTRENVWKIKLQSNTYLYINKNTPDSYEVNLFIDALFNERNKYLRETYFYLSKHMSYEKQLSNLQWLKKTGALKEGEFEMTRKELEAMFNPEKKSIGF
ncbi:hypothetical protein ACX0HA_17280 [Flavobacterium hauense]